MRRKEKSMRIEYYIANRNPVLGGLRIAETSNGFPFHIREDISQNCLELISPDYGVYPLAIYPTDEKTVISMSYKVESDEFESRPHDIINGVLVDNEEIENMLELMIKQDFEEKFIGNIAKRKGNWKCASYEQELWSFLGGLGPKKILGLYHAVRDVIDNQRKIHLRVKEGDERLVQAACYYVLEPHLRKQLFTISNGECTMQDADILITKKIKYQDIANYETKSIRQFVEEGNELAEKKANKSSQQKMDQLLDICMEYIRDLDVPESILCEMRCMKNGMGRGEKRAYERQLKEKLGSQIGKTKEIHRFVQVLFLAYEKLPVLSDYQTKSILPVPYDMQGMAEFLQQHCRSKRIYKMHLKEVLNSLEDTNMSLFTTL